MDAFKLTLIRHGETLENKLKIIQDINRWYFNSISKRPGHSRNQQVRNGEAELWKICQFKLGHKDTILSERGIHQAQLLAKRLENEEFSHIYCSDLRRAHQTCQIIVDNNKRSKVLITTDVRLRERKLGSLEGQPLSSCRGLNKANSKQGVPGMESKQQLRQHAKSFFKDLCAVMNEKQQFIYEQERSRSRDDAPSEEFQDPLTVAVNPRGLPVGTKPFQAPDNCVGAAGGIKPCGKLTAASLDPTGNFDNIFAVNDNIGNLLLNRVSDSKFAEHSARTVQLDCERGGKPGCRDDKAADKNTTSLSSLPERESITKSEASCPWQPDAIGAGAKTDLPMFNIFASALIVSHGGLLMELLTYFVKELKCSLPESQKMVRCVVPNAGISRFIVDLGQGGKILPRIFCLSLFETDHLIADGEDLSPLCSSADCI